MKGVFERRPGEFYIRWADASGRIVRERVTWEKLKTAGVKVPANVKLGQPGKQLAEQLYQARRVNRHDVAKAAAIVSRAVVRIKDLVSGLEADYSKNRLKTLEQVKKRVKKNVLPFWGNLDANAISSTSIDEYIAKRQKEGAADATINREFAALRRMLNLASTKTPRLVHQVPRFERLQESAPRDGFVSDAQFYKLRENASDLWLRAMISTAYDFGFRRSELVNLRVQQIDLLERTIKLNRGETKNGEARQVVMSADVLALITICITGKKQIDRVFTREDGSPAGDFRKAWTNLCKAAGVPGLLFHDLRRSAVRNMIRRGIHETVAMAISGHKTRSVFDRYNITSQSDLIAATAKIEAGREKPTEPETSTYTDSRSDESKQTTKSLQ